MTLIQFQASPEMLRHQKMQDKISIVDKLMTVYNVRCYIVMRGPKEDAKIQKWAKMPKK